MSGWELFITHSLVAMVGVLATVMFSRRAEKRRKVLTLYERYHSVDSIRARNIAWRFLSNDYQGQPIWELYSDQDHEHTECYDALVQVTYFWYALYVLGKRRDIDKRLANELFRAQYIPWRDVLLPLYQATVMSEQQARENKTAWKEFEYLEAARMAWLEDDISGVSFVKWMYCYHWGADGGAVKKTAAAP